VAEELQLQTQTTLRQMEVVHHLEPHHLLAAEEDGLALQVVQKKEELEGLVVEEVLQAQLVTALEEMQFLAKEILEEEVIEMVPIQLEQELVLVEVAAQERLVAMALMQETVELEQAFILHGELQHQLDKMFLQLITMQAAEEVLQDIQPVERFPVQLLEDLEEEATDIMLPMESLELQILAAAAAQLLTIIHIHLEQVALV
jgi:hypothetical protein